VSAYYNEIEPYAAQWLRNLITAGHIAPGEVDERSIADVTADDLRGFTQCHFFAGIGGWSYALRLAGWPDDRPVWTGSCPCQPFSNAGKQDGQDDARHLWPVFARLISECRPVAVFGEQVAGAVGFGWLDGVCADMEAHDYAVGAAVLGAHSVGAPHIRQRLWWVADSQLPSAARLGEHGRQAQAQPKSVSSVAGNSGMGNSSGAGLQNGSLFGRVCEGTERAHTRQASKLASGAWSNAEWLYGADGKARRIEPGIAPLAHGIPCRVGKLRAYGNAIVPQVAAEFIGAYMDTAA